MKALEQENEALKQEVFLLKAEVAQLKKLLFGARRERFVSAEVPGQGQLFEAAPAAEEVPAAPVAARVVAPPKPAARRRAPIERNTFPAALRREEEVIEPAEIEGPGWVRIGEDVTEILAYEPASLYVRRLVRPRYAKAGEEDRGVLQASVPVRLIPKGLVDESLLSQLVVEKILFHTPVHRFRKKLKQAGIGFISENNLYNWFQTVGYSLRPLYQLLHQDLLGQPYNQADETRITVLSKNQPGASHRGYFWVLHNPSLRAVLFQYDARRDQQAGQALLPGFSGILQCDGYAVYDALERKQDVRLIHCMAHARRKFVEAQNTDPPRAEYFLERVQALYHIERKAREEQLDEEQRRARRQQQAVPLLTELGTWLRQQLTAVLPRSPIGEAIAYTLKRWEGLCAYADDGRLEIDNNLIENTIRPVALGRKNFLFAGSDEAAQHLAGLYSIIATADRHGLNVQHYLTWLLRRVATHKVTPDALGWLPHRMEPDLRKEFLL